MRRLVALLSAGVLVASLAASSVSAAPAAPENSLVANFQAIEGGTNKVIGRVTVQLFAPSERHLVPGFYDFYGVPGYPVRESHAQLGRVEFWYDPAAGNPGGYEGPPDFGANVAYAEGVMCDYAEPNVPNCHPIYLWFVDVLDPAGRADYLDTNTYTPTVGDWDGTSWNVGKGAFVLTYTAP
jgi:hypothetical protein